MVLLIRKQHWYNKDIILSKFHPKLLIIEFRMAVLFFRHNTHTADDTYGRENDKDVDDYSEKKLGTKFK